MPLIGFPLWIPMSGNLYIKGVAFASHFSIFNFPFSIFNFQLYKNGKEAIHPAYYEAIQHTSS